jgi:hypothetical protein
MQKGPAVILPALFYLFRRVEQELAISVHALVGDP